MTSSAVETAGKRIAGERPSRTRALVAAAVAGAAAIVMVYRWLRSESTGKKDD